MRGKEGCGRGCKEEREGIVWGKRRIGREGKEERKLERRKEKEREKEEDGEEKKAPSSAPTEELRNPPRLRLAANE